MRVNHKEDQHRIDCEKQGPTKIAAKEVMKCDKDSMRALER